jgi:hypothetical protein
LDGDTTRGAFKSLKEANLKIPVPSGWSEEFDSSTRKLFYVNKSTGDVSWKHPVFEGSNKRSRQSEDSESPIAHDHEDYRDTETGFSRTEFLKNEEKRLKLDRSRKKGIKPEDVALRLADLRKVVIGDDSVSELFTGTPQLLVSMITQSIETNEPSERLLLAGLYVLLEDYKQLKVNKSQLMALMDRIDDVLELNAPIPFPPMIIEWIIGGLKLAIPVSYSV